MPVGINQPSNQIKFTNVSIVRMKKGNNLQHSYSLFYLPRPVAQVFSPLTNYIHLRTGKKRYELACYKNKLLEFRSGAETDLDNVLQVPTVFLSVSRGQTAPTAELTKSFGKEVKTEEIIQEILRKGEIQVGEKERRELVERVEREILEIVSSRLVDPVSKRVYTTGMISKALDQLSAASGQQQHQHQQHAVKNLGTPTDSPAGSGRGTPVPQDAGVEGDSNESAAAATPKKPLWTGVSPTKSAKSQALDAMRALIAWQPIPVMRARMRLRITCPTSILKQAARSAAANNASANANASSGNNSGSSRKEKGKGKKGGNKKVVDDEDDDNEGKSSTGTSTGTVKDRILSYLEQIESQDVLGKDEWEAVGFAEPGAFKGLSEFVGGETKGRGRVEVLDMAVTHEE